MSVFPVTANAWGFFLDPHWGSVFSGAFATTLFDRVRIQHDATTMFLCSSRPLNRRIVYSFPLYDHAYRPGVFQARLDLLRILCKTPLHVTLLYLGYPYTAKLIQHLQSGTLQMLDPIPSNLRAPSYATEQIGRWVNAALLRRAPKEVVWRGMYAVAANVTAQHKAQALSSVLGRPVVVATIPEEENPGSSYGLETRLQLSLGGLLSSRQCCNVQRSRAIFPEAWTFAEWAEQQTDIVSWRQEAPLNSSTVTHDLSAGQIGAVDSEPIGQAEAHQPATP
jgi:hypothetical protein